ncbi:hypothetical protein H6P81_020097 [Aristolochia fimbriata]|uniref:Uncharacterized protein n=1 Tax=Aristolochia fimbriata TaxID=158543 RepID=A0AAV7DXJ0_ARIFI|nr:hypothetical protein H6P81_020097 [Aristolochia fimbriata]
MKQFSLRLLLVLVLLLSGPAGLLAARGTTIFFSTKQPVDQTVMAPEAVGSPGAFFESQKRRVPTGSNPLHNRRRENRGTEQSLKMNSFCQPRRIRIRRHILAPGDPNPREQQSNCPTAAQKYWTKRA